MVPRCSVPCQPYHVDRAADVVGLLCLKTAKEGGARQIPPALKEHPTFGQRFQMVLKLVFFMLKLIVCDEDRAKDVHHIAFN